MSGPAAIERIPRRRFQFSIFLWLKKVQNLINNLLSLVVLRNAFRNIQKKSWRQKNRRNLLLWQSLQPYLLGKVSFTCLQCTQSIMCCLTYKPLFFCSLFRCIFLTEIFVIVFVNVDSLCDRISLVRLVSLGYSALNPLYVASFASPSSPVSYLGARKWTPRSHAHGAPWLGLDSFGSLEFFFTISHISPFCVVNQDFSLGVVGCNLPAGWL